MHKQNNREIDYARDIDIVMSVHNLIEYSDNYSKTSGSVWQYYRDERSLNNVGIILDFLDANNSASFKFKQKIKTLKHLSNFWRTLEMPLIDVKLIFL